VRHTRRLAPPTPHLHHALAMSLPRALLLACLALASCGDAAPDAAPRFRLVGTIELAGRDRDADVSRVRDRLVAGAAVLAWDAAATDAVTRATSAAATPTHALQVTIAAAPTPEEKLHREVRLVDETGAAVAVDLALLHACGVELPAKLPLGTRVFTSANAAAGGTPRAGPGDLVVALLRDQHAAVLAATDPVTLGFVRFADTPAHRRIEAEVRAAAAKHPRVGALVAAGCRAILATAEDPAALATVRSTPAGAGVGVLVLDPLLRSEPGTTVLGADQDVLGRTAAEHVRASLPNGGELLFVQTAGDPHVDARRAAFVRVLGLRIP
jgi:hypothetical protein